MTRKLLCALLPAALVCAPGCRTRPRTPPPAPSPASQPAEPAPPAGPPLPADFVVRGGGVIEEPFLAPEAFWRRLVSELTQERADARRTDSDILVSFEADRVHFTDRRGRRRTWRLPGGLRLGPAERHLLLRSDLGLAVYDAHGSQIPPAPEITVVEAALDAGHGQIRQIRLVIKEGRTFRSISNPG